MLNSFEFENHFDEDGNPAGGFYSSVGIDIVWQNGPLGRDESRIEPNGAFVENVISAALLRLEHYQVTKFECCYNAIAISHLKAALQACQDRTRDREEREVEGTHAV